MTCPYCNQELPEGIASCYYCGKELGAPVPPQQPYGQQAYQQPMQQAYQQQPMQPAYQPPPAHPGAAPAQGTTGAATAALVCGIFSLIFSCVFLMSIPFGIIGITKGTKALKGNPLGHGSAKAGIAMSVIGIVLTIFFIVAYAMGYLEQWVPN